MACEPDVGRMWPIALSLTCLVEVSTNCQVTSFSWCCFAAVRTKTGSENLAGYVFSYRTRLSFGRPAPSGRRFSWTPLWQRGGAAGRQVTRRPGRTPTSCLLCTCTRRGQARATRLQVSSCNYRKKLILDLSPVGRHREPVWWKKHLESVGPM